MGLSSERATPRTEDPAEAPGAKALESFPPLHCIPRHGPRRFCLQGRLPICSCLCRCIFSPPAPSLCTEPLGQSPPRPGHCFALIPSQGWGHGHTLHSLSLIPGPWQQATPSNWAKESTSPMTNPKSGASPSEGGTESNARKGSSPQTGTQPLTHCSC